MCFLWVNRIFSFSCLLKTGSTSKLYQAVRLRWDETACPVPTDIKKQRSNTRRYNTIHTPITKTTENRMKLRENVSTNIYKRHSVYGRKGTVCKKL